MSVGRATVWPVRLLLFSDLHLETGFAWAPPEVGRARRDALRQCLRRIAALATELGVDAVCCGGDLYEHDRHRPDTGAFLRDVFAALDPETIVERRNVYGGPARAQVMLQLHELEARLAARRPA